MLPVLLLLCLTKVLNNTDPHAARLVNLSFSRLNIGHTCAVLTRIRLSTSTIKHCSKHGFHYASAQAMAMSICPILVNTISHEIKFLQSVRYIY